MSLPKGASFSATPMSRPAAAPACLRLTKLGAGPGSVVLVIVEAVLVEAPLVEAVLVEEGSFAVEGPFDAVAEVTPGVMLEVQVDVVTVSEFNDEPTAVGDGDVDDSDGETMGGAELEPAAV